MCPRLPLLPERLMASRAQLSTSLCRSSVNVPFLLAVRVGGCPWAAWLLTAPPTVLVLLVPGVRDATGHNHQKVLGFGFQEEETLDRMMNASHRRRRGRTGKPCKEGIPGPYVAQRLGLMGRKPGSVQELRVRLNDSEQW